jgi:DNA-3-methyladenine glycosylase I
MNSPEFSDRSRRCAWAERSALERDYHDQEWGVPEHDDVRLFEWLILESAQAGLSWRTILEKREGYRDAFEGFDPHRLAKRGREAEEALMQHPGIVRNRLKIRSALNNARAFCAVQDSQGSFSTFLWSFVGGVPKANVWETLADLPAQTEVSRALSQSLKDRGFSFVGPVICYSFMQATGLVDDHIAGCYRACPLSLK